jgi:hypothetical protein
MNHVKNVAGNAVSLFLFQSLNFSQFVARQIWKRRGVSPL